MNGADKILILVSSLFLFFNCNANAASPLQGGVQHSDNLSPVQPELTPGNIFNEKELPKLDPGNVWVAIPNWIAGTWQFKTETVTHMDIFDKKKHSKCPFVLRNEFQKVFGYQKDKSGQIWDYLKAPYSYTAKLDGGLSGYSRIDSVDEVVNNHDEVTRKVVGPDAVVEPGSQKILLTNQKECFLRYTPFGDDAIHLDGSTKVFNAVGHPSVLKISNMDATRIKPFEPIDQLDGYDLKQQFAEFLTAQKRAELIP
jgi:hypothetical protein